MKYRSRTDIIAMVLRATAKGGATKTRLMYSAYLSYAQVKEYVAFLQENTLLRYEDGTQLYTLTEQGASFLRLYEQMAELVSNKSVKRLPQATTYSFPFG